MRNMRKTDELCESCCIKKAEFELKSKTKKEYFEYIIMQIQHMHDFMGRKEPHFLQNDYTRELEYFHFKYLLHEYLSLQHNICDTCNQISSKIALKCRVCGKPFSMNHEEYIDKLLQ